MTLFHGLLDATAELYPNRPALRHQGRTYTYEEAGNRSRSLANAMRAVGLQRGDRVAVYLKNRPEAVELAIACSRVGAIFVPINPMLKHRQLGYMLRDCGARMLVAIGISSPGARAELDACPALQVIVECDPPKGDYEHSRRALAYDELVAGAAAVDCNAQCIDKDPAMIMYTSSSTGPPKGVVVSHHNVVSGARCVALYLNNDREDRILAALPLSFDYGFSQVSTAFAVGACAVLTHYSMARALIEEVAAECITGLGGVPTMWAHLAATEWPEHAGATLRFITNSGGTIAPALIRKLQARLPQTLIYSMYGLTEAFRSTYLDPAELNRRPRSIGKAIPNQEVLVLRPDGSQCEPEEAGELVHRGSLVTLGYWDDAAQTKALFRPLAAKIPGLVEEPAVWSGDMVKRDLEGFLYFLGRKDHLIKTSGYRVSPTEVENIALEVPGIIEAVAVGVPDDVLGQRITLAVIADDQQTSGILAAVRQYCRQHLPAFMVPARILVLASIPRTPNGKHDRAGLQLLLQEIHEDAEEQIG